MAKLIYISNVSLDGFIEDARGSFDWTAPDEEVFAFMGGLVDECQLLIRPVVVGGGKPALPRDARAELELLDERRFTNGVVYLRYRNLI